MIKMLLLNVGEYNKGNVALVKSTIYIIEQFIQDNVQFVLLGPWEGNFYGQPIKKGYLIHRKTNPKKTTKLIITLKNSLMSIWYIFYCIFLRISNELNLSFSPNKKSGIFFYYNCDLVINSGGDHLSGEYGKETISSFLELLYSFILKKPIILFSESLGKFEDSYLDFFAKIIFNRVDLILVRERLSYDYLIENKINNPQIYLTADAAFSLVESDALKIEQILSNEGVYKLKTPIIGLNPSKLITKFVKNIPNKEKKIINILINTINELNKKDFNILLIPHVYTSTDDDRIIINKIAKKILNKSKLHIIKGEYNPEELKGIIKRCDIFVGARMHATIASTSMFIPTVGIAYSHKMHGIIGEMLGLEDYIIDIDNLNYEILLDKILMAWENKEDIHNHLKKVIPKVKERSMRNGELVKKLVDSLNIP